MISPSIELLNGDACLGVTDDASAQFALVVLLPLILGYPVATRPSTNAPSVLQRLNTATLTTSIRQQLPWILARHRLR